MNAIKVTKWTLLEKLRANRAAHKAQFEEAAEGYREKVIELLEERLAEARKGKLPSIVIGLAMPVNQTKQYDRVIGMLEMDTNDVIELEEDDYQRYVLDEWTWSASTTATNSLYTKLK
jgi:predicted transcriptional regulator YdeE